VGDAGSSCAVGGGFCVTGGAAGCDDTAFATIYPPDVSSCGVIALDVSCQVGGDGVCSDAEAIDLNFAKPGPVGVGIDVDRGTLGELAAPVTTLSTNIHNGALAGIAPGVNQTLTDAAPAGGLSFYLVSCDAPGPKHSDSQRINGAPSGRFQNP
jgi:hypothetical protein